MKKFIALIFSALFVVETWSAVSITSVKAQQRYPWDGKVDIEVHLIGIADDLAKCECVFAATNVATKTEITITGIEKVGEDVGSGKDWMRRFVWDMNADVGEDKIEEVNFTVYVVRDIGGVQLWEDGPYIAECNVGAEKPEDYGYYFWWGDTVGYTRNASNGGWVSVQDGAAFSFSSANCPTYGKSNSELQSLGYIDSTGNLTQAHDAATAHLGAPWRMPTDAEFLALLNNCDTTWTTLNGVYGRRITGRGAYSSKSIFLPAAGYGDGSRLYALGLNGYFWSSSPNSDYSYNACLLYFASDRINRDSYRRYCGGSVRPVLNVSATMSSVSVNFAWTGLKSANSINYSNLKGATHSNPATYQEGTTVVFSDPSEIEGYEFVGWEPAAITADMTGDVTVTAVWKEAYSSIIYVDQLGATHTNPTIYREGSEIAFVAPSDVPGHRFVTWNPSSITADMRGDVVVEAIWRDDTQTGGATRTDTVNNVEWTYFVVDGKATIGTRGYTAAVSRSIERNVHIPSRLGGFPVTRIGRYALKGCSNITSVEIPEGVVAIEESAFESCVSLSEVAFPSTLMYIGVRAFSGTNISSIDIPEGVTEIGAGAFAYDQFGLDERARLYEIILPSTVMSLGDNAGTYRESQYAVNPFSGCADGCEISFPNGNARYSVVDGQLVSTDGALIAGVVYNGEAYIPPQVKTIATEAYADQSTLREITIPASVKRICINAFYRSTLENVNMTDGGVNVIHAQAFWYCDKLATVKLPEGLEEVGGWFCAYTPVQRLEFPASVKSLGSSFYYMTNLVEVVFKGNAPTANTGDYQFDKVPQEARFSVRLGSLGWDGDPLSAKMPSSGYWPGPYGNYGRPIYTYGEAPQEWHDGWWTKMNFRSSQSGWQSEDGIYQTQPRTTAYSDAERVDYVEFSVEGEGVFACDLKAVGNASSYGAYAVVDGVEMRRVYAKDASSSPKWNHLAYGVSGAGAHTIRVEFRFSRNTTSEQACIQNVSWISKAEWIEPNYRWKTEVNSDATVAIVGAEPVPQYDVIIPTQVGEKRVVAIGNSRGDNVFPSNTLITSVVIPEGVTMIGGYAFSRCNSIVAITLPKSLMTIGSYAFNDCRSLKTVYVKSGDMERIKELVRGNGVDVDQLTFVEMEVPEIVVSDVNGTITLPEGMTEDTVSIKIMVEGHDIRPYINLPAAVGGVIDLSAAVVKPEVVREALDPEKGAVIELSAENPTLITAETKPGLTYTLFEGTTLDSMGAGASKLGDGSAWTPDIKVKGGASGFYSIKVTK